ncbi:MAG: hypothetical protein H7267_01910 [Sandarakinorhabdus sp.]|nr:hypothetical protein [Sandarakinorhabdus sp.]
MPTKETPEKRGKHHHRSDNLVSQALQTWLTPYDEHILALLARPLLHFFSIATLFLLLARTKNALSTI